MAQLKDSIVSGNLRVTDTTLTDTLQVTTVKAILDPSASQPTYGPGSNGQVLKTNGSTVYWGSDTSSDVNVTQTATTTDAAYEILFSGTADNTTRTETARKNSNLKFNPSTGSLYANYMYAGGSESQSAYPAGGYHIYDCRSVNVTPANGDKTANFYFHMTGTPDTSKWWSVMHVRGWSGDHSAWEIAGPAHNVDQQTTPLYVRTSNKNSAWGSWRKIYDTANKPTASEVGALSTSTKYALSTSVGGNAILSDGLATKTLTSETIDTTAGSFVFGGTDLIGNASYDWAGIQVDATNDSFQLKTNGQLIFRQNDSSTKTSDNWGEWKGCLTSSDVVGSGGITVTQNDITIGSGTGAYSYKGSVTISHSNSIAAQTSTVFKKFSYDSHGHITDIANVAKSDITALGIPAQDTKYGISGAYGSNNNTWVTTITAGGSEATSTVPTASISAYGITKLYNGVDSSSTGLAATANAVKTAYDKANHSHPYLPSTTTYAGSSTVGGAANSAVKLETARTINVGTGVTGTATSFDGSANITIPVTGIKEAYLTWGGKDFNQSFSPLDAALEPRLGANRLEMCAGTGIKIERTTDSGTSWTEVTTSSISNADRSGLFSSVGHTVFVSATSTAGMGTDAAKYMMRITLDTSVASVYTILNKFIFNISSNGCANCYVKLRIRTAANVTAGNDTWLTWDVRNKTWSSSPAEADTRCPIGGWSGFNVINTSGVTTYGNNTSQYRNLQFIFGCTKNDSTSAGLAVINIQGYGGVAWNAPSNMARTGHLYSWTGTGAASFPSSITANGNLIASSASGDSPALIFRRGTLTDNLNDWRIYVSSGHLYFDQSTANASSETWTHKMYYHASDSNLYIGSSPVLHTGNTSFTQTQTSGTKIGSITIAGTGTDIYAPTVNNASLTLKGAGTTVTTFTANASTNQSLDIVAGSNVTITPDATNHKITIASSYTNTTYTIGTSGNNVTLTPSSGSVQSITVPYATKAQYPMVIATNEVRLYNDNQFKADNHFWIGYEWAPGSHYTPTGGTDTASTTAPNITKYFMGNCSSGGLASVHAKTFILGNGSSPTSGSTTTTITTAATTTTTITLPNASGTVSLEGHTHNYVPNTAGGVIDAINLLDIGNDQPAISDYYISQYAQGSTLPSDDPNYYRRNYFYRRPLSSLWGTFRELITISTTGSGNAITSVSIANDDSTASSPKRKITFTKGSTFLASTTKYAGSSTVGGPALSLYTDIIDDTAGSHATVLQTYFNANKSTIPRDKVLGYYSRRSSNGSIYMGYFLHEYDSNPYGGFFVAHYNTPYYVGISNGTYTEQEILTSTNYTTYTVEKDGTGASGSWEISVTGTSANVTGTVAIDHGGTGATTRLNALKNLTNENVGTSAQYFLTITNSWGKGGYTTVADAKTVLGLKSAAYTESSAYLASSTKYAGSSSVGGAATSANKLNTNAGSVSNPVYFTNGIPTACDYPKSGAWAPANGGVPVVTSSGVLEIGPYIDFHGTTSTANYDLRLSEESTNLLALKNTAPTFRIHSTDHTNAALELWREGDNYTDYRIINMGGNFRIQSDYIEGTGHTDWFDMLYLAYTTGNATFKGSGTFGGIITSYRESSTTDNLPAGIVFSNKDTTTGLTYSDAHIYAYNDHANPTYGENLVINASGSLFIGAGESADCHYAAIKSSIGTNEDIYMTADRYVYIQGCGNAIAARKGMMIYTTDSNHGNYHQILPTVADSATNNVGSIGSSSYKWYSMYASNYYGEFDCSNEVANNISYAMVLAVHPDTHEPNTLRKNPNAVISFKNGTASEEGWAQITLGNSTPSGTAGNSTGWLKLYSPSSGVHYITGASTTSAITHTLPAVGGTVLNSGNYLQYTRSIQKLYAATSTKGWRRILTVPAMNSSGYAIGRYEFHFTRQWNNGAPESFGVRVICNYNTPIIRLLYAEQYTRILTDFRVTRSSDSTKIHFEVWYDSTNKNDFSVRYVIQDPYLVPYDSCTFPTETDGSSAGSSFLPVVSDSPTAQATIVIPTGGISQFNLKQATGFKDGYFGMADGVGDDAAAIRTTSAGLLPYESSNATAGGICSIGTPGWYFKEAYVGKVVSNTADFECFQPRHSNEFSMKQITYNYVWFNYRLITDDKQGYTTNPSTPINQYWFGCGKARAGLAQVVTSGMTIYPSAANASSYSTTLQSTTLTGNRTATLPDATGAIPLITEIYKNPSSTTTSQNITNASQYKFFIISAKLSDANHFDETTAIIPMPDATGEVRKNINFMMPVGNNTETRLLNGAIVINYSSASSCVISGMVASRYLLAGTSSSTASSISTGTMSVYITRIVGISY